MLQSSCWQKTKIMSLCPISMKKFWQKTTRKKLPHCPISTKKIVSLSHLHAFVLMIHVHSPTLPFPCSCIRSSIVTCLKLALTASGFFLLKWWTMGYGDNRCCWVLKSFDKFFWQQRQLTDDDKKTTKKIAILSHLQGPVSMLTKDKKKKMSHCPISIEKILSKDNKKKIDSLSHLHKKILLTKDNGDG